MRVVDSDRVAARLDELRVIDVRDPWEYDGIGHLPGAVSVPFDEFRAEEHAAGGGAGEAGMLPGAERFGALLGDAGIAGDDPVLAYDDTRGVFAARFLVTCELYGHPADRLYLLDGDYTAWSREHEIDRDAPEPAPTTYRAEFDPEGPLVGIDAVEAALDDPGAVVVDTREDWEYEDGHIPGAVRLDWRELVDESARGLRPEPEIRSLLEDRGVTPDRRTVLYCNTARRISHTYVVLRHLEYGDLAFYEGSLTEWEAAGRALATGTDP